VLLAVETTGRKVANPGNASTSSCSLDLKITSTHDQAALRANRMDATSNSGAAKILCIERDVAVLQGRRSVLKNAGYDASSASPNLAEVLLRSQKFDPIVFSSLSEFDLHRIINLGDGAEVLVLDGLTLPSELLSLVAQRLNRRQRKA
jgi:hypothetical protein